MRKGLLLISAAVFVAFGKATIEHFKACAAPNLSMTDQKTRARAAIIGGLVADAASAGLHWVYDWEKLDALLAEGAVEFHDPPSCPFYKSTVGNFSPWGHELVPLLKSMSTHHGDLDVDAFGEETVQYFKTESRIPYTNGAIKHFLAQREAGEPFMACAKEDNQAHSVCKVPILVARYGGTPELMAKVEEAALLQQKGRPGVVWAKVAAAILQKIVAGSTVKDALDWAEAASPEDLGGLDAEEHTQLKKSLGPDERPFREIAKENGLSCGLPGAFLNVVVALRRFGSADYVDAMRENSKLGGDNCSRAIFLGACLAAEGGEAVVPTKWREKTSMLAEVEADVDAVALGARADT